MAATRSFQWSSAELALSPRPPNQLHAAMDVASSADGTVRVVGRFSEKHKNNYVNLLKHRDGDDTDPNPADVSRDGALVRLPIGKADGAAPPGGLSKLVTVDTTTQRSLTRYLVPR